MQITKEYGYTTIKHKDRELIVRFRNDYSQLFNKWNWYNFTFIELSLENDYKLGGFEFDFTLLGIGVYLRFNYKEIEMTESLQKMIKEIEEYDKV